MAEEKLPELKLPACRVELKRDAGGTLHVYDDLRRKWLVATPEEWVRQNFTRYLRAALGFPQSMMANEVGLTLNGTRRRCDTLIYRRNLRPLCVVEYKRSTVEITAAVFDQIARYNSVVGAPYLIVSNGMKHYCCRFDGDGYTFLRRIPRYEEMNLGEGK